MFYHNFIATITTTSTITITITTTTTTTAATMMMTLAFQARLALSSLPAFSSQWKETASKVQPSGQ